MDLVLIHNFIPFVDFDFQD